MLMRKHFAGASKARHDFVENQQHTISGANLANLGQVIVRWDQYATACDDWFHNEGCNGFGTFVQNCFFKSVGAVVDVAVWVRGVGKDEAWKQGFVAFAPLPLAGRAQRAHRVAVIAPMSRDDLVATGPADAVFTLCLELTRHLERGFVGFRATVGEVDATGVAEEVDQFCSESYRGFMGHRHGRVRKLGHLFARDIGEFFSAMAHVDAPQARRAVEPAISVGVVNETSLTAFDKAGRRDLDVSMLRQRVPKALGVEGFEFADGIAHGFLLERNPPGAWPRRNASLNILRPRETEI